MGGKAEVSMFSPLGEPGNFSVKVWPLISQPGISKKAEHCLPALSTLSLGFPVCRDSLKTRPSLCQWFLRPLPTYDPLSTSNCSLLIKVSPSNLTFYNENMGPWRGRALAM